MRKKFSRSEVSLLLLMPLSNNVLHSFLKYFLMMLIVVVFVKGVNYGRFQVTDDVCTEHSKSASSKPKTKKRKRYLNTLLSSHSARITSEEMTTT